MIRAVVLATVLSLAVPALADDAEIHTFHCLHGCPMGSPSTNDLIVREIYTLSSNDRTKLADWVAYRVTVDLIGPSGPRRWQADPWLAVSETLLPDHYVDAHETLSVDRGHQAPLASFSGSPYAADTNYLSNITPQRSALNQGPWVRLETAERSLVERGRASEEPAALYVLTGPLYERVMQPLPLPRGWVRHRVPSGYWKVIATADGGLSAFIMDQDAPRTASHCDFRVPLEEVELRTNLTLFPRDQERAFHTLDDGLGCSSQ